MHGRYYRCAAGNWAGDRQRRERRETEEELSDRDSDRSIVRN